MADQKITELPIKGTSAINFADYLLGIDAADGYQMLISDLAKKIIESYAGSNLGGSAQALKTALDAVSGSLATIESSASASRAYAVGEYLVLGGRLYIVTAAILQGGTITPNTNVVEAGVGDKLTGIESLIGTTTLPTTAQTLTGAIAEHETDISTLNGNMISIFKSVDISVSNVSVPANGQVLAGQTPNISGYTCIGAKFVWGGSETSTNVSPTGLQYQSSNNRIRFINTSSSAISVSGTLTFYFVKTSYISS